MAMVNPTVLSLAAAGNVKDSRWLTLEVCREYQRSKCTRTEAECKFAHPPPHVEVQNGRVTACFDSIKVRSFSMIFSLPKLTVNPFPNKPWFLRVCRTSLLKTLGKGEIARSEQFLLFPQCFLPIWITFCHFHQIQNCRLQTISVWKSLKYVVWERVNP